MSRHAAIHDIRFNGEYGRIHYWKGWKIKTQNFHNIKVIMPPGAPVIISDFHSTINGRAWLRPSLNRHHMGIDIYAKKGTPILASSDGIVIEAINESCWGPTLHIYHGPDAKNAGIHALYGHLGEMLVEQGDQVKRGQKIAEMGGPLPKCGGWIEHLHFQIGRSARVGEKGNSWGHNYFITDGHSSTNPHLLWENGPGQVTCFKPGEVYKEGTLTYPVQCLNENDSKAYLNPLPKEKN